MKTPLASGTTWQVLKAANRFAIFVFIRGGWFRVSTTESLQEAIEQAPSLAAEELAAAEWIREKGMEIPRGSWPRIFDLSLCPLVSPKFQSL